MSAYTTSTQLYNWHFTSTELASERQLANESARKRFSARLDPLLSPSTNESEAVIDADEELTIVKSYLFLLKMLFDQFQTPRLPDEVFGVAVTYVKRFYLRHSVLDFHPREIMLTSLYVACKAVDFPIGIDSFAQSIPRNNERYKAFILNSELFLLEALRYDLWVFTPYRALYGFIIDFVAFQRCKLELRARETQNRSPLNKWISSESRLVRDLRQAGNELLHKWYQTDLCLTTHPSQLALTALIELARTRPGLDVTSYLHDELCACDPIRSSSRRDDTKVKQASDSGSSTDDDEDSVNNQSVTLKGEASSDPSQIDATLGLKPPKLSNDESWTRLSSSLDSIRQQLDEFDFVDSLDGFGLAEERLERFRNPLYDIDSTQYSEAKSQADRLLDLQE